MQVTIVELQNIFMTPAAECIRALTVDYQTFLLLRAGTVSAHSEVNYLTADEYQAAVRSPVDYGIPLRMRNPRIGENCPLDIFIYCARPDMPDPTIYTGGLIC